MFKIKDKVKAINRDMVIENINIGSGRAYAMTISNITDSAPCAENR